MISAKKMVEITNNNVSSSHVGEIESAVTARANGGKFYAKLWEGKPTSLDTKLIFIERYDVEAYNHVMHMGYTVVSVREPSGVVGLYIGWGFDGEDALKIAIKYSEED